MVEPLLTPAKGVIVMKIDNIEVPFVNEDECQNFKETLSKYGKTVVCDEEDEKLDADIVLPGGEGCETTKEIVSKYGVKVVCDEEDK